MARFATLRAIERSDAILRAVTEAAQEGRPCPTPAELGKMTGLGRNAVYVHLKRLERLDYITITGLRPRIIRINALGIKTADPVVLHVQAIAATIARVAGLAPEDIIGRGRSMLYSRPRVLACHFARAEGISFAAIARALGRDHSTITYACSTVARRLRNDRLFQRLYARAEAALRGGGDDLIPFTPARLPAAPSRYEIGEDGELEPVAPRRQLQFDPLLNALRSAHPERCAA